jgi:uncharacterized protein
MKITNVSELEGWLPKHYVNRDVHSRLMESLKNEEVTVLYGARQVGKSAEITLCMKQILEEQAAFDVWYFNLDRITPDFEDPERFINAILSQRTAKDHKIYVFLDEAQRLTNIGVFVKYIYDRHLGVKFVLTGSASLEIKQKIKEPLTGRKEELLLMPLNLGEILRFTGIDPKKIVGRFEMTDRILDEYLRYGGYPAVVTAISEEEKIRKLTEIADSYVTRDVSDLFGIANREKLILVASFLARNVGGVLSREGLGEVVGVSKYETEKILNALDKSFITFAIRPFAKDRVKEMVHRPKVYFADLGIRNALLRKLDPVLVAPDRGELFENAVGLGLVAEYGIDRVKYWRTNNKTEVDFVVLNEGERVSAYEAKFSFGLGGLPRNMISFRGKYGNILNTTMVVSKENYWGLV